MLTVTDSQIKSMGKSKKKHALLHVEQQLIRFYPDHCEAMGEIELRRFVEQGIEVAVNANIHDFRAVTKFVALMLQFGEQFERSPVATQALQVLNHPKLPGMLKVEELAILLDSKAGGRVIVSD